jgi:YHS domain-containing protein
MSSAPELVEQAEVIDPVCGMSILPSRAAGQVEHEGRTYYFCSTSCMRRFQDTPEAFLGGGREAHKAGADAPSHTTPAVREYTCPMDPEIRQAGPGARAGVARAGHAHGVDLPDAPGDRPHGAGVVPDLRHGPRAARRDAR